MPANSASVFSASKLAKVVACAPLFVLVAIATHAQARSPSHGASAGGPEKGTITVFIRGPEGGPISVMPKITLSSAARGQMPGFAEQNGSTGWVFSDVEIGDTYEVHVTADGYEPATQDVELIGESNANVIVFMTPVGEKLSVHPATGQFVLAPRAQKEVEKGLKDLDSSKIISAQKHFQKALTMAPGNPYVNYVMGMSYLIERQLPQARPYLEKSVSIDPKQPYSLLALGTLRFESADYSGATQPLNESLKLDHSSWKAEWMLADCYLHEHDYAQARIHAEQSLSVGGQKATIAQLLLGEALAGLGQHPEAIKALQTYLAAYPRDPHAAKIQSLILDLQKAPTVVETAAVQPNGPQSPVSQSPASLSLAVPASAPPVELPPKENWAPADVDAEKPFVISGAACPVNRVLDAAAKNAVRFVTDIQKFSATEEYQSIEVKRNESLETPDERTFSYMMFIEKPRPRLIELKEIRDSDAAGASMPGQLVDNGAPALALAFHPDFRDDFNWRCEGLSEWNGQSVWLVRFEQRSDRPTSLLASFQTSSEEFALPLKGLAWVSAKTSEVVRLEADLVHPVEPLGLKRQHWVIEYAPVEFTSHKTTLWLPERVDVYIQFQNHYLHHQHRFSNFKLFWVGTSDKIAPPKQSVNSKQQ
jgi:Tfp pilus assembly protein PilF